MSSPVWHDDPPPASEAADPRVQAARNAFLAGFPLVATTRIMQGMAQRLGVNRMWASRRLSGPDSRAIVAPNLDTVYALAVLDLRAGPLALTLPGIRDRYHSVQLLDAWMGGFGLLGTRTTGGRGGTWAILPPGHSGRIPDGLEPIPCPTGHAFLLCRIRALDAADAAEAGALAAGIDLRALAGDTGGTPLPPPAGRAHDTGRNGIGFFDELCAALPANPPVTAEQRRALDAVAGLGVAAGRRPGAELDETGRAFLEEAAAAGLRELEPPAPRAVNGWTTNLGLGTRDTHGGLRERAMVARYFWGPVPAEEAIYPRTSTSADGLPLDGSKRYRVRFPKDGLPPVDAFWSLTAYGPDMFLVPNRFGRYSISGDDPGLVTGADGSLDLHLSHEPPAGFEANWLPVPPGRFNLILRLYLPRRPVLDGAYAYPPVAVLPSGT
ncbi:hypothetical protein Nocox_13050 [Nonomuraea coxensis DSM 45129]|uniref:Phosphatidylserine decarboxylase n=1 Tax=Nonomuraea coxensis DSM 45129 TaxID=1122611 RepID=A0ABX8U0T0_9ACTN|nr:DUF1214 domain-containing protein [Nonomuraea coxensis]QYC40228.1 hypothetical protein Nocox_13050 [Nonomuraea coxensis DSM 45129]